MLYLENNTVVHSAWRAMKQNKVFPEAEEKPPTTYLCALYPAPPSETPARMSSLLTTLALSHSK